MVKALLSAIIILGSATVALALYLQGITNAPVAAMIGAFVVLSLTQVESAFVHRRERRRTQRDIAKLKRHAQGVSHALSEAYGKIDELNSAIDARTQAQSKQIVSELKVLEGLVRDFAVRVSEKARLAAAVPTTTAGHTESGNPMIARYGHADLLETIRASLEENRVDLYLQPIVTLPQRKVRYYEALTRLRTEDGTVIMPSQYLKIAASAGLMSVIDNLLLFRCVQIMRRLIQKNREIGLFCNVSADTLSDIEFFPQFLEFMHHNRDLAAHIHFEFAQSAILNADARARENLSYLAGLGFSLSMDHVETLALDPDRLRSLGFRHIKVRAEMLSQGSADASVAVEDLKELLARHGISMIAERVESERTAVQLLDYNIDLGQGFLFGEPRAARDEQKTLPDAAAPVIPFRRAVNH